MPSFGEKLKSEREKRAITLEQISLSTKIGTRMLQALEEEQFNQLPGGIFNRGFVRAYARHVGLDEEQAVADYLEASGEGPALKAAAELETQAEPPETREPAPPRQIPWGLLAALLLLLALALSLWSRRQHKHEPQPAQSSSASTATQKPVQDPVPGSNPAPPGTVKSEISPAPTPTAAAPVAAASTPADPGPLPSEFTVVILAREDSWVSITADGKVVLADTLVAGNQRAVRGRKEVVIRAGNTGALDFVFNGKKLSPQGDYGEVKTVTFGASGLQPPSPAASVTQ